MQSPTSRRSRRSHDSSGMDFDAAAHNMPQLDRLDLSALIVKLYSDIEDLSDFTHTVADAKEHGNDYVFHTLMKRLPFLLGDAAAKQQGHEPNMPSFRTDAEGLKIYDEPEQRFCGLAEKVDRTRTAIAYDIREMADRVDELAQETQEDEDFDLATRLRDFAVQHSANIDVPINQGYDLITEVLDIMDGQVNPQLHEYFDQLHRMRTSDVKERHQDLQRLLSHAQRRTGNMYNRDGTPKPDNHVITPDLRERTDELIGKIGNSLGGITHYSPQIIAGILAISLSVGGFFGIRSVVNKALSKANDQERVLYGVQAENMPPKGEGMKNAPYTIANAGNVTEAYDRLFMQQAAGQFPSSEIFNRASEYTLEESEAVKALIGAQGLADPLFWNAIAELQNKGNQAGSSVSHSHTESGHWTETRTCTTDSKGKQSCTTTRTYHCDSWHHHFSMDPARFGDALKGIIATEMMPTNQGAVMSDLGLPTFPADKFGNMDNNEAIKAYNNGVNAVNTLFGGGAQGVLDKLPSLPTSYSTTTGCYYTPSWEPSDLAGWINGLTNQSGSFKDTYDRMVAFNAILDHAQQDIESSVTSPYQTWAYELGNRATESVNAVGFPKGNHYFKSEIEMWATIAGIATGLAAIGITFAGYKFLVEGGYQRRREYY